MSKRYLIVGAGPAGLALACSLMKKGIRDLRVIEAADQAGGLCRSVSVDGSGLDIGGGHFLDVRRPKVNEFLFSYMPQKEWNRYERDSRISVRGNLVGHPLEANIWQFPEEFQKEYLDSIEKAGCNTGKPCPQRFVDWIYWKLGDRIAEDYMIPYNKKMFGDDLDSLGTYWLEKLPDVSYEETRKSCEMKRPYGTQPGHASFFYPKKYGYGELWLRMADSLGDRISYDTPAQSLDIDDKVVNGQFEADVIINTAPWASYKEIKGLSRELSEGIKSLKKSSIVVRYFDGKVDDDGAQWIYYPDPELSYHRLLIRYNFLPGAKGYWSETNLDRDKGMDTKEDAGTVSFVNEYAYPLNTIGKPQIMDKLLGSLMTKQVYGLGRWGEHNHYNSDLVVELAMNLADRLYKEQ